MRSRPGRSAGALAAVALCLVAGACAPDGDVADRASSLPGTASPAPAALAPATGITPAAGPSARTPADMVLNSGELKGYEITPLRYEEVGGTERSDDSACAPLVGLVNLAPQPVPVSTVLRTAVDASRAGRDDQTVVTMLLAAYTRDDEAASLVDRVRRAVADCGPGFRTRGGDGPAVYTAITALPAPRAGEDALAFRMSCGRGGQPSPLVFTVVRSGAAVVVFSAANYLDGVIPVIPPALVTVQAAKLPHAS
ncbi:hypothetical protein [Streptomyces sp. NPDC008125]|uniref:hypothetical protein n=1 Tax=Streptomyces sp. NPDC008125 TaxID=3364811 RepID=UPI0036DFB270